MDTLMRMTDFTSENEHLSLIELLTPTATDDPTTLIGIPNDYGRMGIYGGHFLGQAIAAGFATVPEPKLAHSLHAYFMRQGDPQTPIEYRVQILRDGRGTSTRAIGAWQNGAEVFHMIASYKLAESGDEHQPTPPVVPPALDLVAKREAKGEPSPPLPPTQNGWVEIELAGPSFFEYIPDRDATIPLWMRVPEGQGLTDRQRQIVIAFLCDGPLMFNSILPYGAPMQTHWATTIDHSAWFHRPVDPSQWMLFDQRSTAAADGRGMNSGEIYGPAGELIMTCAQESVLRRLSPETTAS